VKRRAWKIILGLLGGAGLAFFGVVWSAHRRANEVFERHDRLVREAIESIRARSARRPSLYDPPIEGNGWTAYMDALNGITAIPAEEGDEIPAIKGEPEFVPDRERLGEVFQKYAPLIDDLRKSFRHDKFVPKYDYEQGLAAPMSNISEAIRTARYLSGLAEYLHEEGQDGPALEALTLGLALGHDTGRSGPIVNQLVQIVCESIEAWGVRDLLSGHSLEAADLESFARKLDRLSDARPSVADSFAVEDALMRRTIVEYGRGSPVAMSLNGFNNVWLRRSWRYFFSNRLALAGALGELEDAFRQARAVSGLAPHLRAEAMRKDADRVMASKNPVVLMLYPAVSKVYARDAFSQMELTLMRVATAIAWYESERGQPPEKLADLVPRYLPRVPACPLTGMPLGYRDGAVWSPGKNGIDDGGTPGRDNDPDAEDGDVVWWVRRE
jgi:hypothetical protein